MHALHASGQSIQYIVPVSPIPLNDVGRVVAKGCRCQVDNVDEGWWVMAAIHGCNRGVMRRVDKAKGDFYTSMYEGLCEPFFPSNRQTIIMQPLESVG